MSLSVLLVAFSLFDTSLSRYRSKRGLRLSIEADDPRQLETTRTFFFRLQLVNVGMGTPGENMELDGAKQYGQFCEN